MSRGRKQQKKRKNNSYRIPASLKKKVDSVFKPKYIYKTNEIFDAKDFAEGTLKIDNTNKKVWISIYDPNGNAVWKIKNDNVVKKLQNKIINNLTLPIEETTEDIIEPNNVVVHNEVIPIPVENFDKDITLNMQTEEVIAIPEAQEQPISDIQEQEITPQEPEITKEN